MWAAWVGVMILGAATLPGEATFLEDLSGLRALAHDAEKMVKAARAFDLRQQALAQWDRQLADEYRDAGNMDLAEAKIRESRRRLDAVKAAYDEVIATHPNNAAACNYFGELLYDVYDDPIGAMRHWKQAAVMGRHLAAPLNNMGLYYCHTGNAKQGVVYLEEAVKLEPKNPDFLFNLTQIYLNWRRILEQREGWKPEKVYREAMKLSARAVKYAPDDFDILQDYAVNFFGGKNFGVEVDWGEAARAWQQARPRARNKNERFYTWLNEARAWREAGNRGRALECLDAAEKIRPDSPYIRSIRGQLAEGR